MAAAMELCDVATTYYTCTMSSESETNPSTAATVTAAPAAPFPPGLQSFLKCLQPGHTDLHEMAVCMLIETSHTEVLKIPKRGQGTGEKWKALMTTFFEGQPTGGERDGNGLFRHYSKWKCKNPATVKLRVIIKGIVDEFSGEEFSDHPSPVVTLARQLKADMCASDVREHVP